MAEQIAMDYANYLHQLDFAKEIAPICTNMDEILTRMDEFESSISIIRNISAVTSLSNIMQCKKGVQQYSERIDKIQIMLERINSDITTLEQNMDKAEEDLGFNSSGIKGFFKPLLGKIAKNRSSQEHVDDSSTTYEPIEPFKAADYFGESNPCDLLNRIDETK